MDDGTERHLPPLVLVVDDDPALRRRARTALEAQGFAVEEAADGAGALAGFEATHPDVVLIAASGPALDGVAVCQELRRRPAGAAIPIVMTTPPDDVAAIERAYDAGASGFARKPLDLGALPLQVRYELRERHAHRRLSRSEQRFRQLAENLDEVFWIGDLGGQEIIYVSPAYEQIWGRTCASLYACPQSLLEAIHPHDQAHAHEAGRAVSRGAVELEYRIVRPDGTVRWVRDRRFPLRSVADGRRRG
jgi:PAS domain S-box-containing protein